VQSEDQRKKKHREQGPNCINRQIPGNSVFHQFNVGFFERHLEQADGNPNQMDEEQ
jgi:hypothetical protein